MTGVEPDGVQAVLRQLLGAAAFDGRDDLLAQVDAVEIVGGPVTMLELRVQTDHRAAVADGVLPVEGVVVDGEGTECGVLLVWVRDGLLSGLEYAWWTDEPPTLLPGWRWCR